jgi:hypothetical protein
MNERGQIMVFGGGPPMEFGRGVAIGRFKGVQLAAAGDAMRAGELLTNALRSAGAWPEIRFIRGDVSYCDFRRLMLEFYEKPPAWLGDGGTRIHLMRSFGDTTPRQQMILQPLTEIFVGIGGSIDPTPTPERRSSGFIIPGDQCK